MSSRGLTAGPSDFQVQITPFGIVLFDQRELPFSSPFFQALLSSYCRQYVSVLLEINQSMNPVFRSESIDQIIPMLVYPLYQIRSHTHVQSAVSFTGENVGVVVFFHGYWIPRSSRGMTSCGRYGPLIFITSPDILNVIARPDPLAVILRLDPLAIIPSPGPLWPASRRPGI